MSPTQACAHSIQNFFAVELEGLAARDIRRSGGGSGDTSSDEGSCRQCARSPQAPGRGRGPACPTICRHAGSIRRRFARRGVPPVLRPVAGGETATSRVSEHEFASPWPGLGPSMSGDLPACWQHPPAVCQARCATGASTSGGDLYGETLGGGCHLWDPVRAVTCSASAMHACMCPAVLVIKGSGLSSRMGFPIPGWAGAGHHDGRSSREREDPMPRGVTGGSGRRAVSKSSRYSALPSSQKAE